MHPFALVEVEMIYIIQRMQFNELDFKILELWQNFSVTIWVILTIWLLIILNFFLRGSRLGVRFHGFFEKFSHYGPQFVRFTVAIALFLSAYNNTFLGPELALGSFPYHEIVRILLYVSSIMIALGIFTEIAALIATCLFFASFFVFGPYISVYLNYLGELLVLLFFGMRVFSLDEHIFGPLRKKLQHFEKYETLIVRIFYGLALVYTAITVKILNSELAVSLISNWDLSQLQWILPNDPLLIALGAGIIEIIIGMFIIVGFEMRLTTLISLVYITLSVIFFKQLVGLHTLLLYGISISLLVQPEKFTIDHLLFDHHKKAHSWWKRPFLPHNESGKSTVKKVKI